MGDEALKAASIRRGQMRAQVTKSINAIAQHIAEDDLGKVKARAEKMKESFGKLEEAHELYDSLLETDKATDESEAYFLEIQTSYIASLNGVKAFIKEKSADESKKEEKKPEMSQQEPSDLHKIVDRLNLPQVKLEHFAGDPLKFKSFMAVFDEHVHRSSAEDSMKLSRLLEFTEKKALEAIRPCSLMKSDEGYKKAREILEKRFGNHHIISDLIVKQLKTGKQIRTSVELQEFADDLNNHYATLNSLSKLSEIDTQSCILDVVNRLQPFIRNRWKRYTMDEKRNNDRYPNFKELVEFITREAEDANDPVCSQIKSFSRPSPGGNATCLSSDVGNRPRTDDRMKKTCVACKQDHRLFYCPKFKAMRPGERLQFVKDHKLCENCLMSNHQVSDCRKSSVCTVPGCGLKHTKFIHVTDRPRNSPTGSSVNANDIEVKNASVNGSNSVCVPVVPVIVNDQLQTTALLDTASTSSFCTRRLVERLGVQGSVRTYNLSTISQADEIKRAEVVNLYVKSTDETEMLKLSQVYVIDSIPASMPDVDVSCYSHLVDLPIADFDGSVDLLIGQDHAEALIPMDTRKGKFGEPFAVRTLFGWSLNGPASSVDKVSKRVITNFVSTSQIDMDVQKLWNVENEGISKEKVGMSIEDKLVLDLWDNEVQRCDGHYQLPIPFKEGAKFPNNFSVAFSRLKSLKCNLIRRGLMSRYDEEITKLCVKNYAEKIPIYEIAQRNVAWYLPHQAVISESKPGKIRVVFDCSSRYQGESLNDKCLQGPDINNRLLHVLLRFRNHRYAITADVEAMYYQVLVPPMHRDFLRFLWQDETGNLEQYRMLVHVFGGVWSGSAAAYALRRTVDDFGVPGANLVSEVMKNAFYVDDCLVSVDSREDAKLVIQGVKELLHEGGFNLTKFVVNDEELLSLVPESDRASEVKDLHSDGQSKALGVKWDVKSDHIYFDVRVDVSSSVTRRVMLSTVSSMFDPLGLITPALIRGKVLFQDATRLNLSWDDPVPSHLVVAWHRWLQSLEGLNGVQIPRCVKPSEYDDSYLELHHFSDANERAYGCCSFLRCVGKDGKIHTALLCSKGKVAPIKTLSIPRLELQAAVLAVRMDSILREELNLHLGESRFWVDSEIVLKYIANETQRFHVFVSNRVSEIRSLSKSVQWCHVSGVLNPADLITRGVEPGNLMSSGWFDGPDFIRLHKSEWNRQDISLSIPADDPEVKSDKSMKVTSPACASACAVDVEVRQHPVDQLVKHYSSWYKLKRAVGWLLRLRTRLLTKQPISGPLSVKEIESAESLIIKHVQAQFYDRDIKLIASGKSLDKSCPIRDLLPVLDSSGLLRVGGRIRNAQMSENFKHPLIIPHKSTIALLVAREMHNVAHLGTEWTLGLIRRKYWITRARCILKSIKGDCVSCRKLYAIPGTQRIADLPLERLMSEKPAFSFVGTDCFGPILVKVGRSQVKRYGCVFTCFTTRAVHVEVLSSLDTDSMVNALRRFIARRGCPLKIWSDNGTNFVGCHNELSRSLKQLNNDKLHEFCTKQDIEWVFNTPAAPHMGGVFERMVKTIKRVLVAVLGNARLTDENLSTFVCEVENLINSRPITKVSDDACDLEALSPNHLLILKGGPSPIPGVFQNSDLYRKRWRCVQHLVDIFWKRWIREYLPQLQSANKWHDVKKNVKVNDLVLIVDESTPRGLWPLGIVTNVKLGDDDLVRTVHVKTKSTELVRPITKIVLLESV